MITIYHSMGCRDPFLMFVNRFDPVRWPYCRATMKVTNLIGGVQLFNSVFIDFVGKYYSNCNIDFHNLGENRTQTWICKKRVTFLFFNSGLQLNLQNIILLLVVGFRFQIRLERYRYMVFCC
jgi:hypothetical protein